MDDIKEQIANWCFRVQIDEKIEFARYSYLKTNEQNDENSPIGFLKFHYTPPKDDTLYVDFDKALENIINFIIQNCSGYSDKKSVVTLTNPAKAAIFELNRCSSDIAHVTRRGSGNFIIASADIIKQLLTQIAEHHIDTIIDLNTDTYARYKIIRKDIGNKIIVGYKGSNVFDNGIAIHEIDGKYFPILTQLNTVDYYRVIHVEPEQKET